MKDWFKPNAIPQAEIKVGCDEFENKIRECGVGFSTVIIADALMKNKKDWLKNFS